MVHRVFETLSSPVAVASETAGYRVAAMDSAMASATVPDLAKYLDLATVTVTVRATVNPEYLDLELPAGTSGSGVKVPAGNSESGSESEYFRGNSEYLESGLAVRRLELAVSADSILDFGVRSALALAHPS